jgi:Phage tail lysozyme/Phage-related minor tail protein
MAARTISIAFLGNTADLEKALERAGLVAQDSSEKIATSARAAGDAAAEQAKKMGASADEQEAAAARAAAAWVEASAKMSTAQKAAGDAAATTARKVGASVDEQQAAFDRAVVSQGKLEAASKAASDAQVDAAAKASAAQDAASEKVKNFGSAYANLGKWAIAGGLAAAGVSVDLAMKYQTATESIAANSDITSKAAAKIGQAFLGTAGHSIYSGEQISEAFASVAGQLRITEGGALNAAQALRVMNAAGDLAEASGESLTTATGALSSVMQGYHLSVNQAAGASDTLFNVSRALNVPVETIASSLDKLHGRLGTLAPSLGDVSGLMVELGQHGIQGSRGVLVANTAMQTLVGGSANTTAVLKDLGVNVFNAQGKFIGMQGVIAELGPKIAALSPHMQDFALKTLFGSSAAQVMGQILEAGVPKFQQATDAATKLGTAHKAAEDQSKTLAKQFDILKATVEDLATKFGLVLIPAMTDAAHVGEEGIDWLEKHKAAAEALAIAVGTILGPAVALFAYQKMASFVSGIQKGYGAIKTLEGTVSSAAQTIGQKFGLISTESADEAESVSTSNEAIESSNNTAGTSFSMVATKASTASAKVATEAETMATSVTTADETIVEQNSLAGASFTALIPLIGAAAIATELFNKKTELAAGTTQKEAVAELEKSGVPSGMAKHLVAGLAAKGAFAGGAVGATSAPGAAIGVPSSGSNAQRIAGALKAQGFSDVAIAGILGNFAQETGGGTLTGINTADSGTGASGMGGMGIAQWTMQRRQAEMAYASSHHESDTSLAAQVGYLVQELRTDYHGAYTAISQAKSPQQAAAAFNQIFEGGTDPGGVREREAEAAYKMLTSGSLGGSGSSSSASATGSNPWLAALMKLLASGKSIGQSSSSAKSKAAATSTIPVAVATMLSTAQALLGTHYVSGGGHGSEAYDSVAELKKIGLDCSGFVSAVLRAGGVTGVAGLTTSGLASTLQPGKGKDVTVYDRANDGDNSHTIMEILGKWFEEGGNSAINPSQTAMQLTAAQAAQEMSSGGFQAYHPEYSGKLATNAQLKALGVSGSGTNTTTNVAALIAAYIQKVETALLKSGDTLGQKLATAIQNGSVRSLESALGVSTSEHLLSMSIGTPGAHGSARGGQFSSATISQRLNALFAKGGTQGAASLLTQGEQGSTQQGAFNTLIAELRATGSKSLDKEADRLVAAHKAALGTLVSELYSAWETKTAGLETLQATQLKDQTTLVADAQANIVTAMKDAATQIADAFGATATAIKDASQSASDASSATVQGIQDQSAITTDTLAERGLYGLNLVAQQQQVVLDQITAASNGQMASAQAHLDAVQSSTDAVTSSAQAKVDAVTTAQDVLVSAAQAKLDNVTKTTDAAVQKAANAETAASTGSKAANDAATAAYAKAQATASLMQAQANAALQAAQNTANNVEQQAQSALSNATASAQVQLAAANAALTTVQDQANVAEANQQAIVAKEQAMANTQYAGSGVNIYVTGINPTDAAAVASEIGWVARTAIPT